MNELLCGTGRKGAPTVLADHPQANTSSNFDPKQYLETWARVESEADDAGYVKISQPE